LYKILADNDFQDLKTKKRFYDTKCKAFYSLLKIKIICDILKRLEQKFLDLRKFM